MPNSTLLATVLPSPKRHIANRSGALLIATLLTSVLISGCSGHPGTGNWQVENATAADLSRIDIRFDGTANVWATHGQQPLLGCFWQAANAEILNLQCAGADNPETPQDYRLRLLSDNHAELHKGTALLARLVRQP